jgi:hypothetical protein
VNGRGLGKPRISTPWLNFCDRVVGSRAALAIITSVLAYNANVVKDFMLRNDSGDEMSGKFMAGHDRD